MNQTPTTDELNAVLKFLLASVQIVGDDACHLLRPFKSPLKGFALNEMAATYRSSIEYERSFEIAVNVVIDGFVEIASRRNPSDKVGRSQWRHRLMPLGAFRNGLLAGSISTPIYDDLPQLSFLRPADRLALGNAVSKPGV